jgi:hypothetical protein
MNFSHNGRLWRNGSWRDLGAGDQFDIYGGKILSIKSKQRINIDIGPPSYRRKHKTRAAYYRFSKRKIMIFDDDFRLYVIVGASSRDIDAVEQVLMNFEVDRLPKL